jgi:hypothetical protein
LPFQRFVLFLGISDELSLLEEGMELVLELH